MKIRRYPPEIEAYIFNFYNSLSEKDCRRYAAIEAEKLGYGGASYIQRVLHCDDRTIARSKQELKRVQIDCNVLTSKVQCSDLGEINHG